MTSDRERLTALHEQIEQLDQEHRTAPFPKKCYEQERISGISLVLLDADIAGCVSVFLKNYNLDLGRTATLGRCYHAVSHVIPHLPEEAVPYFTRLETLTSCVLEAIQGRAYLEQQGDTL